MLKESIISLGVMIMSDVYVNDRTYDIMVDVTHRLKPVVLTSALRPPSKQAKLMVSHYNRGVNMFALYGEKIRYVYKYLTSNDVVGLAQYLSIHQDFSSHLCGAAVDIRSRTLKDKEIQALKEGLSHKYDVIVEHNPPHIHIETKEGCKNE